MPILLLIFLALVTTSSSALAETVFVKESIDFPTPDREGEYLWLHLDDTGTPHFAHYNRSRTRLEYATRSGNQWVNVPVDGTEVGENVGRYAAMTLDGEGDPHITYLDDVNKNLKHAWRESGVWNVEVVDSEGEVGRYSTIRFQAPDTFHVTYYRETTDEHALKYAVLKDGEWTLDVVDDAGQVGLKARMVLDEFGYPHVAYYDETWTALKYARLTPSGWEIESPDGLNPEDLGSYTSIALDSNGRPHIAYYDHTNHRPLYIRKRANGTWGRGEVVDDDPADVGRYVSLQLDSADRPRIAYYDFSNEDLKFAVKVGNSWESQVVDGLNGKSVGAHAALVLGPNGESHIGYFSDISALTGSLKYAVGDDTVSIQPMSVGRFRSLFSPR